MTNATKGAVLEESTLEEIKRLAAEISDLAAADDQLDAEARDAFVRYAHRIREAADLYRVSGAQALIDELDRFHHRAHRMKTAPGTKLWEAAKQMTAYILVAVELFTAPVNVSDAIDHYQNAFSLDAITEAPGSDTSLDVVEAEVEDESKSA